MKLANLAKAVHEFIFDGKEKKLQTQAAPPVPQKAMAENPAGPQISTPLKVEEPPVQNAAQAPKVEDTVSTLLHNTMARQRRKKKALGKMKAIKEKNALKRTAKPAKAEVKAAKRGRGKNYHYVIRKLKAQIANLQSKIAMNAQPSEAVEGIKEIYHGIKSSVRDIDADIREVRALADFTEQSFLQRKIDEATFRQKMQSLRERLHILKLQKSEMMNRRDELASAKDQVPDVSGLSLDQLAKAKSMEDIFERQTAALEKIAGAAMGQGGKPWPAGMAEPLQPVAAGKQQAFARQDAQPAAQSRQANAPSPQAPAKQAHIEQARSLEEKFKGVPDSKKLSAFIEQKASGRIDEAKLAELEGKMDMLMQKYNIPEQEIEARLSGTSTGDALDSVSKLVTLLELERRANAKLKEPERIETAMRFTEPIKETAQLMGIATEIKKHRLVTDFDKVVVLIAQKGRITFREISRQLAIPYPKVEECCRLLKDEGQIDIFYPTFGEVAAQIPDYNEKTELEKLKPKDTKKGGQPGV